MSHIPHHIPPGDTVLARSLGWEQISKTGRNGQDFSYPWAKAINEQLCVPCQARSCLSFGGRDAGVQGERCAGCFQDEAVGGKLVPQFLSLE